CGDRDRQADADLLYGLGVEEAAHGREDDDDRGQEDHDALDRGGEVLRLAVAELVVVVSGAGRDVQHDEGDKCGYEVDDRLRGVTEEADGTGDEVGRHLQGDGRQRGRDSEPGELREVRSGALRRSLGRSCGHAPIVPPLVSDLCRCPGATPTPAEWLFDDTIWSCAQQSWPFTAAQGTASASPPSRRSSWSRASVSGATRTPARP